MTSFTLAHSHHLKLVQVRLVQFVLICLSLNALIPNDSFIHSGENGRPHLLRVEGTVCLSNITFEAQFPGTTTTTWKAQSYGPYAFNDSVANLTTFSLTPGSGFENRFWRVQLIWNTGGCTPTGMSFNGTTITAPTQYVIGMPTNATNTYILKGQNLTWYFTINFRSQSLTNLTTLSTTTNSACAVETRSPALFAIGTYYYNISVPWCRSTILLHATWGSSSDLLTVSTSGLASYNETLSTTVTNTTAVSLTAGAFTNVIQYVASGAFDGEYHFDVYRTRSVNGVSIKCYDNAGGHVSNGISFTFVVGSLSQSAVAATWNCSSISWTVVYTGFTPWVTDGSTSTTITMSGSGVESPSHHSLIDSGFQIFTLYSQDGDYTFNVTREFQNITFTRQTLSSVCDDKLQEQLNQNAVTYPFGVATLDLQNSPIEPHFNLTVPYCVSGVDIEVDPLGYSRTVSVVVVDSVGSGVSSTTYTIPAIGSYQPLIATDTTTFSIPRVLTTGSNYYSFGFTRQDSILTNIEMVCYDRFNTSIFSTPTISFTRSGFTTPQVALPYGCFYVAFNFTFNTALAPVNVSIAGGSTFEVTSGALTSRTLLTLLGGGTASVLIDTQDGQYTVPLLRNYPTMAQWQFSGWDRDLQATSVISYAADTPANPLLYIPSNWTAWLPFSIGSLDVSLLSRSATFTSITLYYFDGTINTTYTFATSSGTETMPTSIPLQGGLNLFTFVSSQDGAYNFRFYRPYNILSNVTFSAAVDVNTPLASVALATISFPTFVIGQSNYAASGFKLPSLTGYIRLRLTTTSFSPNFTAWIDSATTQLYYASHTGSLSTDPWEIIISRSLPTNPSAFTNGTHKLTINSTDFGQLVYNYTIAPPDITTFTFQPSVPYTPIYTTLLSVPCQVLVLPNAAWNLTFLLQYNTAGSITGVNRTINNVTDYTNPLYSTNYAENMIINASSPLLYYDGTTLLYYSLWSEMSGLFQIAILRSAPQVTAYGFFGLALSPTDALSVGTLLSPPANLTSLRGSPLNQNYTFQVSCVFNTTFGTDIYGDTSNLGAAALHAGFCSYNDRPYVSISYIACPATLTGSTRYGLTSSGLTVPAINPPYGCFTFLKNFETVVPTQQLPIATLDLMNGFMPNQSYPALTPLGQPFPFRFNSLEINLYPRLPATYPPNSVTNFLVSLTDNGVRLCDIPSNWSMVIPTITVGTHSYLLQSSYDAPVYVSITRLPQDVTGFFALGGTNITSDPFIYLSAPFPGTTTQAQTMIANVGIPIVPFNITTTTMTFAYSTTRVIVYPSFYTVANSYLVVLGSNGATLFNSSASGIPILTNTSYEIPLFPYPMGRTKISLVSDLDGQSYDMNMNRILADVLGITVTGKLRGWPQLPNSAYGVHPDAVRVWKGSNSFQPNFQPIAPQNLTIPLVYTVTVPFGVDQIFLTVNSLVSTNLTLSVLAGDQITILSSSIISNNSWSPWLTLPVGVSWLQVTSPIDGSYNLQIIRQLPLITGLGLKLSQPSRNGTIINNLDPAPGLMIFDPFITNYTLSVPYIVGASGIQVNFSVTSNLTYTSQLLLPGSILPPPFSLKFNNVTLGQLNNTIVSPLSNLTTIGWINASTFHINSPVDGQYDITLIRQPRDFTSLAIDAVSANVPTTLQRTLSFPAYPTVLQTFHDVGVTYSRNGIQFTPNWSNPNNTVWINFNRTLNAVGGPDLYQWMSLTNNTITIPYPLSITPTFTYFNFFSDLDGFFTFRVNRTSFNLKNIVPRAYRNDFTSNGTTDALMIGGVVVPAVITPTNFTPGQYDMTINLPYGQNFLSLATFVTMGNDIINVTHSGANITYGPFYAIFNTTQFVSGSDLGGSGYRFRIPVGDSFIRIYSLNDGYYTFHIIRASYSFVNTTTNPDVFINAIFPSNPFQPQLLNESLPLNQAPYPWLYTRNVDNRFTSVNISINVIPSFDPTVWTVSNQSFGANAVPLQSNSSGLFTSPNYPIAVGLNIFWVISPLTDSIYQLQIIRGAPQIFNLSTALISKNDTLVLPWPQFIPGVFVYSIQVPTRYYSAAVVNVSTIVNGTIDGTSMVIRNSTTGATLLYPVPYPYTLQPTKSGDAIGTTLNVLQYLSHYDGIYAINIVRGSAFWTLSAIPRVMVENSTLNFTLTLNDLMASSLTVQVTIDIGVLASYSRTISYEVRSAPSAAAIGFKQSRPIQYWSPPVPQNTTKNVTLTFTVLGLDNWQMDPLPPINMLIVPTNFTQIGSFYTLPATIPTIVGVNSYMTGLTISPNFSSLFVPPTGADFLTLNVWFGNLNQAPARWNINSTNWRTPFTFPFLAPPSFQTVTLTFNLNSYSPDPFKFPVWQQYTVPKSVSIQVVGYLSLTGTPNSLYCNEAHQWLIQPIGSVNGWFLGVTIVSNVSGTTINPPNLNWNGGSESLAFTITPPPTSSFPSGTIMQLSFVLSGSSSIPSMILPLAPINVPIKPTSTLVLSKLPASSIYSSQTITGITLTPTEQPATDLTVTISLSGSSTAVGQLTPSVLFLAAGSLSPVTFQYIAPSVQTTSLITFSYSLAGIDTPHFESITSYSFSVLPLEIVTLSNIPTNLQVNQTATSTIYVTTAPPAGNLIVTLVPSAGSTSPTFITITGTSVYSFTYIAPTTAARVTLSFLLTGVDAPIYTVPSPVSLDVLSSWSIVGVPGSIVMGSQTTFSINPIQQPTNPFQISLSVTGGALSVQTLSFTSNSYGAVNVVLTAPSTQAFGGGITLSFSLGLGVAGLSAPSPINIQVLAGMSILSQPSTVYQGLMSSAIVVAPSQVLPDTAYPIVFNVACTPSCTLTTNTLTISLATKQASLNFTTTATVGSSVVVSFQSMDTARFAPPPSLSYVIVAAPIVIPTPPSDTNLPDPTQWITKWAVNATLYLYLDASQISPLLKTKLQIDISRSCGIDSKRVVISSLSAGSILASFQILPSTDPAVDTPQTAYTTLVTQLSTANSTLLTGEISKYAQSVQRTTYFPAILCADGTYQITCTSNQGNAPVTPSSSSSSTGDATNSTGSSTGTAGAINTASSSTGTALVATSSSSETTQQWWFILAIAIGGVFVFLAFIILIYLALSYRAAAKRQQEKAKTNLTDMDRTSSSSARNLIGYGKVGIAPIAGVQLVTTPKPPPPIAVPRGVSTNDILIQVEGTNSSNTAPPPSNVPIQAIPVRTPAAAIEMTTPSSSRNYPASPSHAGSSGRSGWATNSDSNETIGQPVPMSNTANPSAVRVHTTASQPQPAGRTPIGNTIQSRYAGAGGSQPTSTVIASSRPSPAARAASRATLMREASQMMLNQNPTGSNSTSSDLIQPMPVVTSPPLSSMRLARSVPTSSTSTITSNPYSPTNHPAPTTVARAPISATSRAEKRAELMRQASLMMSENGIVNQK